MKHQKKRQTLLAFITVFIAFICSVVLLEFSVRVYNGNVFSLKTQMSSHRNRIEGPQAVYHPQLGWVPKTGRKVVSPTSITNIDSNSVRLNGTTNKYSDTPILAIGDSYTFGDEVHDDETWPAQLEKFVKRPVINAGVFAYGLDQAILRGEILSKKYNPSEVVLALISDDINRTEFSYYWAWKPYFDYTDARLELRNNPVPKGRPAESWFNPYRRVLGYSFLATMIVERIAPSSWNFGGIIRKK